MKDNEHKLLEEAYLSIVKEMAMPYFSKMPSVEKVSNKPRSAEEYERRKIDSGLRINENLQQLKANPNNLRPAFDILNIMYSFVDKDDPEQKERQQFLVGDEELSYVDILEMILDLVRTEDNNPDLLLKTVDDMGNTVEGMKVDEYKRGKNRTADHYVLFRTITDALPDRVAQTRSRRETEVGQEGKERVDLFYFVEKHDVYYKGTHIGYQNPKLFWPNEEGKKMGFDMVTPGKYKNWYIKYRNDIKLENRRLEPFFSFTWDYGSTFDTPLFYQNSVMRQPRRASEPKVGGAPYIPNTTSQYKPPALLGKTMDEIKILLRSEEAERKFRELYPKETYPELYKGGNKNSVIDLPPF